MLRDRQRVGLVARNALRAHLVAAEAAGLDLDALAARAGCAGVFASPDQQRVPIDAFARGDYIGLGYRAVVAPPTLGLSRSGNLLQISWSGPGTLQASDSVSGTYTDVTPAPTSPYTVDPTSATAKFYRLKR